MIASGERTGKARCAAVRRRHVRCRRGWRRRARARDGGPSGARRDAARRAALRPVPAMRGRAQEIQPVARPGLNKPVLQRKAYRHPFVGAVKLGVQSSKACIDRSRRGLQQLGDRLRAPACASPPVAQGRAAPRSCRQSLSLGQAPSGPSRTEATDPSGSPPSSRIPGPTRGRRLEGGGIQNVTTPEVPVVGLGVAAGE